jgi:hypothetical protein
MLPARAVHRTEPPQRSPRSIPALPLRAPRTIPALPLRSPRPIPALPLRSPRPIPALPMRSPRTNPALLLRPTRRCQRELSAVHHRASDARAIQEHSAYRSKDAANESSAPCINEPAMPVPSRAQRLPEQRRCQQELSAVHHRASDARAIQSTVPTGAKTLPTRAQRRAPPSQRCPCHPGAKTLPTRAQRRASPSQRCPCHPRAQRLPEQKTLPVSSPNLLNELDAARARRRSSPSCINELDAARARCRSSPSCIYERAPCSHTEHRRETCPLIITLNERATFKHVCVQCC